MSASASSEHPTGGHLALHVVDGSGMVSRDGAYVGALCTAMQDTGCSGLCWASDAASIIEDTWLQFDFGRPRHVDMMHLYAYNDPHGRAAARSLRSLEVQVPSRCENGGWVTVGRLHNLPGAPLVDGDGGINVRRAGLPSYFIPWAYRRGGAAQLTADWLGFHTRKLRFARMVSQGAGNYGVSLGLCEVCACVCA